MTNPEPPLWKQFLTSFAIGFSAAAVAALLLLAVLAVQILATLRTAD